MIIVKLMGGLGNQMFQYALARQLAIKNNVPLKMDLSYLRNGHLGNGNTKRDYELQVFNISEEFAKEDEVAKYFVTKPKKFFPKLIFKIKRLFSNRKLVRERFYEFDSSVLNTGCNVYLDGFWQTEKYFRNIEKNIRKDFLLKKEPEEKVKEFLNQIQSVNSVSIHIRRGDYITNAAANAYHGVCSLDYYNNAISMIASKVEDPYFFIFSDEIQWAKENLVINYRHTFVEYGGSLPAYEDLRLMSACKHNIIANSSFSWWGAWLNNYKDKIVVAPNNWFEDKSKNLHDLLPEKWIKINK